VGREVIDPGPFRFKEIHGPRRSVEERNHVVRLLKKQGRQPVTSKFRLETVPVVELIESLLAEAHHRGYGGNTFQYDTWRSQGAPEAALRDEFAASAQAARSRRPQDVPRLNTLAALYRRGATVDPLIAMEWDFTLSTGAKALILLDGRHRMFAVPGTGVDALQVYVLISDS
jgi:hypothetical protein